MLGLNISANAIRAFAQLLPPCFQPKLYRGWSKGGVGKVSNGIFWTQPLFTNLITIKFDFVSVILFHRKLCILHRTVTFAGCHNGIGIMSEKFAKIDINRTSGPAILHRGSNPHKINHNLFFAASVLHFYFLKKRARQANSLAELNVTSKIIVELGSPGHSGHKRQKGELTTSSSRGTMSLSTSIGTSRSSSS